MDVEEIAKQLRLAMQDGNRLKCYALVTGLNASQVESVLLLSGFTVSHEKNKKQMFLMAQEFISKGCANFMDGYQLRKQEV